MTQNKNTFEDVSIVHAGTCECTSFLPGLAKVLRSTGTFTPFVSWKANTDVPYVLSNNDTRIRKDTSADNWHNPIHSVQSIPVTKTFYIQMKLIHVPAASGLIFGLAQQQNTGTYDYSKIDKIVCLYNSATQSFIDEQTVTRNDPCGAMTGDVYGIVVDVERDEVRFYVNCKWAATGKRKPSDMKDVYVAVWMYPQQCELELGHYFPYSALERPLWHQKVDFNKQ
jgi:hypothetical protein